MEEKKQQILKLVKEYIDEKHQNKKWIPGKDPVQYSGPYFDSKEYTNAVNSLLDGWLALGKDAITFESRFPKLFGKDYGIVTNSGSSSNLLMMSSMRSKNLYNFPKGTKVITPVAGFPTTVNPILQNSFEPLFVDICLDTLNLNMDQVEQRAKEGARIIIFAHALGNPPNVDYLMEIVNKYNLILLEDCCDALGSTYKGKLLGSFGEMASCSLYCAHHITIGEGGFISCKTKKQENVLRSFRDWGRGCECTGLKANLNKNGVCGCRFNNWLESLPDEIFDHRYIYGEIGFNLKPIELQCSMGVAQLEKLPEIIRKRKENFNKMINIFSPYENYFILPKATLESDPSWFAFALVIKDNSPFKRKDICGFLENNLIQTRTYFGGNLLLQPAYKHLSNTKEEALRYKVATKITTSCFFLGLNPNWTSDQLDYIQEKINEFMRNY